MVTAMMGWPHSQVVLQAADGSLDPTFGQGGLVKTSFPGQVFAQAADMAIQPDGKIVAVGSVRGPGGTHIGVARYNTDGSLDQTFGKGGQVVTQSATQPSIEQMSAVALQADGKIVVAGFSLVFPFATGVDFAVVRYNHDGSLDTSFGANGFVTTDFGTFSERGLDVAIQDDGKIVVVGEADQASGNIAIARYNTDGSLDLSFGGDGKVTTGLGESGGAVAIQGDGKIVVASFTPPVKATDFAIVRFENDGSLDAGFGAGGVVTTDFGRDDRATGLVIQPDGKIVAVGTVAIASASENYGVARYNPDGSLDSGFGTNGLVISDLGARLEQPNGVALQADGKIVVAGIANELDAAAVVRYNADGALDTAFGTAGVVRIDFDAAPDPNTFASFSAVAVQSDGKIVAAGAAAGSFALARLGPGDVTTTR